MGSDEDSQIYAYFVIPKKKDQQRENPVNKECKYFTALAPGGTWAAMKIHESMQIFIIPKKKDQQREKPVNKECKYFTVLAPGGTSATMRICEPKLIF